jgi:hypothetical protein
MSVSRDVSGAGAISRRTCARLWADWWRFVLADDPVQRAGWCQCNRLAGGDPLVRALQRLPVRTCSLLLLLRYCCWLGPQYLTFFFPLAADPSRDIWCQSWRCATSDKACSSPSKAYRAATARHKQCSAFSSQYRPSFGPRVLRSSFTSQWAERFFSPFRVSP